MATFEELKIPQSIIDKIRAAAQEDESLVVITTPDGLTTWLTEGNKLSDAIESIELDTENTLREVLGVDAIDAPNDQGAEDSESEDPPPSDKDAKGSTEPVETSADSTKPDGKEDPKTPAKPAAKPAAKKVTKKKAPKPKVVPLNLKVPLGQIPDGYEASQAKGGRLSLPRKKAQIHLTPDEAQAFLMVREGLLAQNKRLPDGRPITSNADVIRYLIAPLVKEASKITAQ